VVIYSPEYCSLLNILQGQTVLLNKISHNILPEGGGNLVLGRIALRRGQIEEAKRRLLEAGESPGSPQMDSFGPNMSLAKDLLEKGERDTVLKYFGLCRKFWKMDYGQLKHWSNQVNAGEIPDFGANLVY